MNERAAAAESQRLQAAAEAASAVATEKMRSALSDQSRLYAQAAKGLEMMVGVMKASILINKAGTSEIDDFSKKVEPESVDDFFKSSQSVLNIEDYELRDESESLVKSLSHLWFTRCLFNLIEIVYLLSFPASKDAVGSIRFRRKQEEADKWINFQNAHLKLRYSLTEKDEVLLGDIIEILLSADGLSEDVRRQFFDLMLQLTAGSYGEKSSVFHRTALQLMLEQANSGRSVDPLIFKKTFLAFGKDSELHNDFVTYLTKADRTHLVSMTSVFSDYADFFPPSAVCLRLALTRVNPALSDSGWIAVETVIEKLLPHKALLVMESAAKVEPDLTVAAKINERVALLKITDANRRKDIDEKVARTLAILKSFADATDPKFLDALYLTARFSFLHSRRVFWDQNKEISDTASIEEIQLYMSRALSGSYTVGKSDSRVTLPLWMIRSPAKLQALGDDIKNEMIEGVQPTYGTEVNQLKVWFITSPKVTEYSPNTFKPVSYLRSSSAYYQKYLVYWLITAFVPLALLLHDAWWALFVVPLVCIALSKAKKNKTNRDLLANVANNFEKLETEIFPQIINYLNGNTVQTLANGSAPVVAPPTPAAPKSALYNAFAWKQWAAVAAPILIVVNVGVKIYKHATAIPAGTVRAMVRDCNAQNIDACIDLAKVKVARGQIKEAAVAFETACGLKNMEACSNAGLTHLRMGNPVVAQQFSDYACYAGSIPACLSMYNAVTYGSQDSARSRHYAQKLCQLGTNNFCDISKRLTSTAPTPRESSPTDRTVASVTSDTSVTPPFDPVTLCENNDFAGCDREGHRLLKNGDSVGARRLFDAGCLKGNADLCMALAVTMESMGETESALRTYGEACEKKSAQGCFSLGSYYLSIGQANKAESYMTQSCQLGWATGCAQQGLFELYKGSTKLAKALFSGACETSEFSSCAQAGELQLAMGEITSAHVSFNAGCTHDDAASCSRSKELQAADMVPE